MAQVIAPVHWRLLLIATEVNYRLIEVPLRRRDARIAERVAGRPSPDGQSMQE